MSSKNILVYVLLEYFIATGTCVVVLCVTDFTHKPELVTLRCDWCYHCIVIHVS